MKTNFFSSIGIRHPLTNTRNEQRFATLAIALLCCVALESTFAGEKSIHPPPQKKEKTAPVSLSAKEKRMEQLQAWEHRQRAFPLEQIPLGARQRALAQIQQADALTAAIPALGASYAWFEIGPSPIHDTTSPEAAGRVSAIAVDPFDATHWLLGAAQGGIWESKDGGDNWLPQSDGAASLAIGAIAFAPNKPKIVYAGTGEANFSGDSYAGMGLLKSSDGGTSWFLVAGTPFVQTSFSDIKVHNSNPDILVVATARGVGGRVEFGTNIPPAAPSRGIFVSQNGGTNWTHTLFGEATDVEVDPANFNHQYAALGEIFGSPTNGVYRSTNGGMNWSRVSGPWSATPTEIGRIEMAIAPFTPNRLYVSVATKRTPGGTDLLGIYQTDNAWSNTPTWIQISTAFAPDPGSFPWYSHDLLVNPADPDVLYFAGITVWRYDHFGWQNLPNQHPDQHALAFLPTFDPNVKRVLAAHDGGLSSRFDNFGSWSSHLGKNNKLAITQLWRGAVHPYDSSLILGASQDNGTELYSGSSTWNAVRGGDGYSCAIAASNPDKFWAVSHQLSSFTAIWRTQDGKTFNSAMFGIDTSTIDFFIGFVKHPANDDLFIAGSQNLWRCEDFFSGSASWSANSPTLNKANGDPADITAIGIARSDSSGQIYAYGTEDGQLRLTTNAGAFWRDIDASNAVPDRYVSGLAFSPTDPQVLYVTLSGFDEGTPGHTGHVFKTSSALSANPAWLNVSPPVNLPQNCIAIDPVDAQEVFVGSDIGVWRSGNGGASWTHHGPVQGMPNVAVFDLQFDNSAHITAFTHGRGAFAYRQLPIISTPNCFIVSCWPLFINPEDLVTIDLPLHDDTINPAVDVTATLRPTAQIMPFGGAQTQNYGPLSQAMGVVTHQFQFQAMIGPGGPGGAPAPAAAAGCGGTAHVIFDLTEAGAPLGSIDIPMRLGRLMQPLMQNFEGAIVPELPTSWIGRATGAGMVNTSSNPPPNVVIAPDPDEVSDETPALSGPVSISAFLADPPSASDSSLYSPMIPITTSQAQLRFRHSFDTERTFDGCVLEIAIGTQGFRDILDAGGSFSLNGYNLTLAAGTGGPLGGRRAWSGNSGGWLITEVNLPPGAALQTVQLRWRLGSDISIGRNGWYIDDISIDEYPCVPPVPHPVSLRPGFVEGRFGFFIDTVPDRTYYVDYKDMLDEPVWHLLQSFPGDGPGHFIIDPTRGPAQRFYRFHVE